MSRVRTTRPRRSRSSRRTPRRPTDRHRSRPVRDTGRERCYVARRHTGVPMLRGVRVLDLEAAVSGVFTGGSYALVGVAITLMFRSTGVLSFAHAAFAAVAAFVYVDFEIGRAHV